MRQWLDTDRRCQWPEQRCYAVLRSVVLYGQSPAERALETGVPRPHVLHVALSGEKGAAPLPLSTSRRRAPRRGLRGDRDATTYSLLAVTDGSKGEATVMS
jgi:hypothetical protein